MKTKLLAVALLAAIIALTSASQQSVTVRGTLICNRERWANAKVELWDRDTFDPNDLLATVYSDHSGYFQITGEEEEMTKIEPFIRVTHHCRARHGCSRASEYDVPREFINNGIYDISYLSLDPAVHNEKEHCN